jgi:5'(3')-deoxyribonucleotidase
MNLHLIIDIDGVIADHAHAILKRLREKYGLHARKAQLTTWNPIIAGIHVANEVEAALQDPEFVLGMERIQGARSALSELSRNHSLTIATSRPPLMDELSREWLHQNGIPYQSYFNTRGGGKGNVRGDVLVDDDPESVVDFAASGRPSILFAQPWNERFSAAKGQGESSQILRACGWDEVSAIVRSLGIEKGQHRNPPDVTTEG